MSTFIEKLNRKILSNAEFIESENKLFSVYIDLLTGKKTSLERALVKKLAATVQYFYKSEDQSTRKKGAAILAMLLDTAGKDYSDLVLVAKSIYFGSGDFPNISLLDRRYSEVNMDYGFYTNAEFEFKEILNTVDSLNFTLTDYQRTLWESLNTEKDVITVAPTSAGKTHIILNYLVNSMIKSDGAFAAIIVPTRALISEVSGKVHLTLKRLNEENNVAICTVPRDIEYKDKTIFVMTQERLYDLLQAGDLYFNYLFIDEAHNISDKSRGVLLHLTIDRVLEDSSPQVIVSMPSGSYQNSFNSIFKNVDFHKEITHHSPVAKILMNVKLVKREIQISRINSNHTVNIAKNFSGNKTSDIVLRLGKDQSNIVYGNKTNYCESIAQNIADNILEFHTTPALEEAADYIEQFVHHDFTLANNLRKGVAFHYGPLPSAVRVMIEQLVKDGDIKFITCTSTLAEGVNLPAKNLFLKNPIQPIMGMPSERIEDVKIKNITGRAGRMVEHFSGNIFLIDPEAWAFQDYFDEAEDENEEKKIPTYFKTINEDMSHVLSALDGSLDHAATDQFRFYTIANKLIKEFSNNTIGNTLNAEELQLSQIEMESLRFKVESAYSALKLPPFTLEANPTIGYIQQNKLFEFLRGKTEFSDWVIPHPKSTELYEALKRVAYKLDEFGVYDRSEDYSIEYITLISTKWISGKSLKEIISEQISWDDGNTDSINVNRSVRRVIKVINNDVSFRLRNALSCYHLLLTNAMKLQSSDKTTVKIHTYLEIGACDERMISLINLGVSRESAKEIDEKTPTELKINSIQQLALLLNEGRLEQLHAVTKKEIKTITS